MAQTVMRIRVEKMAEGYAAVKEYGDDLGWLEEIGSGKTPAEAIQDLIGQIDWDSDMATYNELYK